MKKLLIILSVVLAIAAVGAVGVFYYQTRQEISETDGQNVLLKPVSAVLYSKEYPQKRQATLQEVETVKKTLGEFEVKPIEVAERGEGERVAYLTFDDGPGEYTEKLLDILDEYEVKATFFVIGKMLNEDTKPILKEISDRGHAVGVHCNEHDYKKVYKSKQAYIDDFEDVFEKIYEVTGKKPKVFRFPGGSTNSYGKGYIYDIIEELESRGFSYYDWNVSTGDGGPATTTESVIENVKNNCENYDEPVILMHDIKKSTVNAVPQVIKVLKKAGYRFDTVDHREPISFISRKNSPK